VPLHLLPGAAAAGVAPRCTGARRPARGAGSPRAPRHYPPQTPEKQQAKNRQTHHILCMITPWDPLPPDSTEDQSSCQLKRKKKFLCSYSFVRFRAVQHLIHKFSGRAPPYRKRHRRGQAERIPTLPPCR